MSTLTRATPAMYSTLTLQWDDENRLKSTQQSQGDLTTYYYDHTGDRMLKIVTPPAPPPASRPTLGTSPLVRQNSKVIVMPQRTLTPTRYTEIEGVTPKTTVKYPKLKTAGLTEGNQFSESYPSAMCYNINNE